MVSDYGAYDGFWDGASLGQVLNFSERLGKDPEDRRTLSYTAVNELGMDPQKLQFSASQQAMLLEMIYNTKTQVETYLDEMGKEDFEIDSLSSRLQSLMAMMGSYRTFNETMLGDEERVNYHNTASDYIKPVRSKKTGASKERFEEFSRAYEAVAEKKVKQFTHSDEEYDQVLAQVKEDIFRPVKDDELSDISDPQQKALSLQVLYDISQGDYDQSEYELNNYDKNALKRFVSGFTDYADYLLNVASRKKINGKTLKDSVKEQIEPITREYVERAEALNNQTALYKLEQEFDHILTGKTFLNNETYAV